MNAGEKARLRKQKQRQMMLRLWMPVLLVVVLVAGLTAGGISLSLGQSSEMTKEGTSDSQKESNAANEDPEAGGDVSDNSDNSEPESGEHRSTEEEPEETETQEPVTEADYSQEQEEFDDFITNLNEAIAANSSYLDSDSEELARTITELKNYDRSHLTASQVQTYDALLDGLNIEVEAEQYASVEAAAGGVPLYTVEGGVDYYNYLLRKYSGLDETWDTLRVTLANEATENFGTLSAMSAADSTLQMVAASFTKQSPDEEYAYENVSASSSELKKNIVCNGFINGWTEFGLIRAYFNDTLLDSAMQNYLVVSTRMTYALYGVADISVHAGGWGEAEVSDMCTQFFGEAGGGSFGSSVYQMVLSSPGRYAAAAADYLQIAEIEAALSQQLGDSYSEEVLIDFLFNQGPANFRIMRSWLGLQ